MAGNSTPIFSRVGAIGWTSTVIASTVTEYTGTGTNNIVPFTADSTNGGFVQRIRFKSAGTNSTASVARIYINNGQANTTASNNIFYGELSLPAVTATPTAATVDVDYPMNLALNPGYRIVIGISSSAPLGSGWVPSVIAGAY
jgi:hypothetical protein